MGKLNRLDMWTDRLDLEGYEVVHERQDRPDDPIQLTLLSRARFALCPHCQRACESEHVRRECKPIRDLSHGTSTVELLIHMRQFYCSDCERYFTPPCPHVAEGTHATTRFLEQAVRMIRFADIANVAQFFRLPEKTLQNWYYDYVQRKTQQPITTAKPIVSMGIDELSQKKSTGSS